MSVHAGFRRLSSDELALLQRLLSATFAGVERLRKQLSNVVVRQIDEDGSLEVRVLDGEPADVVQRVPVEGRWSDKDGVPVEVMIHVVEGYLYEFEVLKLDGSKIVRFPDISEVELFVYPE